MPKPISTLAEIVIWEALAATVFLAVPVVFFAAGVAAFLDGLTAVFLTTAFLTALGVDLAAVFAGAGVLD